MAVGLFCSFSVVKQGHPVPWPMAGLADMSLMCTGLMYTGRGSRDSASPVP